MKDATEIEFLKSLPIDGTNRTIVAGEYDLAFKLHKERLVFVSSGLWPEMRVCVSFEGRRVLARAP